MTSQQRGPTSPEVGYDAEVVVVGAGPTGLLLAGDLAAAGRSVTLVERRSPGHSNLTRAFGVHARTLEQLDARDLAEELIKTGTPLTEMRLFRGLTLDLRELRSRFPFLLITPQYEVERLLERRAEAAGVRFRYDTELLDLTQDAHGATLRLRDRTAAHGDGAERTLRAAYAVGTDGHRSAVRRALGLPFPGEAVLSSIVLADVRLAEPPGDRLTVAGTGGAFAFIAPFGDGYHRVFGWEREGRHTADEPLALDEVRDITRRALGRDLGMHDARWLSRFHSDERQVPAYRVGRVLLAGDAAHVHSPAGGQGMNTGLQDAANLSWKLAAALGGHRDAEALLDSYHAERHPVGASVLRSSGTLIRLAMATSRPALARRAVATRLFSAVAPLRRRMLGQVTGLGYRYRAPRGAHRLTGRRAPDLALAGGVRLHEALRGGTFVLITPSTPPGAPAPTTGPPGTVTAHWAGPARRTRLLIRPDGYIAWASEDPTAEVPAEAVAVR